MAKRDFDTWFSTFRESISTYDYYTDFNNVYENAEIYKEELHLLNSLINSKNIKLDFEKLLTNYPKVVEAIPMLLAVREHEIYCQDGQDITTGIKYNFNKSAMSISEYSYFMEKTGLFDLLANHVIANLYDYVLGVNTGLDSNGRKNRGGHLMEDLVESYLKEAGVEYYKEMTSKNVEKKFGINLSSLTNKGKTKKRFDYVAKGKNTVYGIECNFYASNGSKLNETARSYKMLAQESKEIDNFVFVWFTDGIGWESASNNLRETFDVLETLYNINELENGIIAKILK